MVGGPDLCADRRGLGLSGPGARSVRSQDRWLGDERDAAPGAHATVKVECVHGEHFKTRAEAQQAIVEYIGYYNTERRHSSLGNVPPAEFERRWRAEARQPIEVVSR